MSTNDFKNKTLAATVGREGTTPDLELAWLMEQTGATTIPDGWKKMLRDLGHTGSIADMLNSWLTDKGYTGSLTDKLYQLWESGDIGGGSGVDIDELFSTDLWTGTGALNSIVNGLDYISEDWLVWIRNRDLSPVNHILTDTVRGATRTLFSDLTSAETLRTGDLSDFNADGYTVRNSGQVNRNGDDIVGWSFKKAPKFFDIIKYAGDSTAGREIPHELGIQAGLVLTKRLNASSNWMVQHVDRGGSNFLVLNEANAESSTSTIWDSTDSTESVVTVGSPNVINGTGYEYIMYVFAHDPSPEGVIQCGSYIGTGTPGNPIELGWEPQYIMIKRTDDISNWIVGDSERGFEPFTFIIRPNLDSREEESAALTLFPNPTGFSFRSADSRYNELGGEYIYMAIRAPE